MSFTTKEENAKYQKKRRTKSLTMLVPDEEFKDRVKAAARQEKRSVSNWMAEYIMPAIERELEFRERHLQRGTPVHGTTTLTDKMLNDAKRGLKH